MVDVAQLVRATDCGSVGRGFEPHLPPYPQRMQPVCILFLFTIQIINEKTQIMKKLILCAAVLLGAFLGTRPAQAQDWGRLLGAGAKVLQAGTISDDALAQYISQYVHKLDSANTICAANDPYAIRLDSITKGLKSVDGIPLNFKVYKTNDVNAFACADGSVRVYSGLMDIMTDDQVLGVIGHELGHVAHHDTKKAFKQALINSALRDGIAAVPQDPRTLFTADTVRADLASLGRDAALLDAVVQQMALAPLLDRHPFDLSGGEQQRAALAKVLLMQPRVLLLDEPTKGMDGAFKAEFGALLRKLCAQGTAVCIVSHDVEFCAQYADRCGLLFRGEVVTENDPRAFFSGNYFYTTAAARIARTAAPGAVLCEEVVQCLAD